MGRFIQRKASSEVFPTPEQVRLIRNRNYESFAENMAILGGCFLIGATLPVSGSIATLVGITATATGFGSLITGVDAICTASDDIHDAIQRAKKAS